MNRRSFFKWLGLAGTAIPATKAAKAIAESLPPMEAPVVEAEALKPIPQDVFDRAKCELFDSSEGFSHREYGKSFEITREALEDSTVFDVGGSTCVTLGWRPQRDVLRVLPSTVAQPYDYISTAMTYSSLSSTQVHTNILFLSSNSY